MSYLDLTKLKEEKVTVIGEVTIHTKGGMVHRDHDSPSGPGPAIHTSWSQEWYVNGQRHGHALYRKHPQPSKHYPTGEHIVEVWENGVYKGSFQAEHEDFMNCWHVAPSPGQGQNGTR